MNMHVLLRQLAFSLSLLASSSAIAGEVVVDPPLTENDYLVSRPLTVSELPWYSIAQSFRAEDPKIQFGFRLRDDVYGGGALPNAGVLITYRLYAGENDYDELLGTRYVAMPSTSTDDSFRGIWGDAGFVEADFSQVTLEVGAQYTMRISVSGPVAGNGPYVWLSDENPYPYGRMYFPEIGVDPSDPNYEYFFVWDWSNEDLLFRMSPVGQTAAQQVAALRSWIAASPAIGTRDRKVLINKLHRTLGKPDLPAYQTVACRQLTSFIQYVDRHSNRFDNATAVILFDRIEDVMGAVPCA